MTDEASLMLKTTWWKMAARQNKPAAFGTLRMLRAIASRRHGARVSDLVTELEVSRASVYRYIAYLEEGVGLVREQRNC